MRRTNFDLPRVLTSQVEGEAQGTEEALQKFLKDIDNGPRAAHVVKLEKRSIDTVQGESSFVAK